MGNYNPRAPFILGEEWVPIRDEDIVFSPSTRSIEYGHNFRLTASTTVRDGRFYVNEFPPGPITNKVYGISIYPDNLTDKTGPIERLVIPVSSGAITGSTIFINGTSVQEAVLSPTDDSTISFGEQLDEAAFYFPISSYPVLNGKRILGLNVLYLIESFGGPSPLANNVTPFLLLQRNNFADPVTVTPLHVFSNEITASKSIQRARIGEINFHFISTSPQSTSVRGPWTYSGLLNLMQTATNRINVIVTGAGSTLTSPPENIPTDLNYLALEVIYCEERRVAVGFNQLGNDLQFSVNTTDINLGTNIIPLRALPALTTDPVLQAGAYDATLSLFISPSDLAFPSPAVPEINALRELYQIPSHGGFEVKIPIPLEDHIGETLETVESPILPQLSLHGTTGAAVTEVHAYGRQVAAEVWGTNTVTQHINDNPPGASGAAAASYPQVRYYARRFGDTTVNLLLNSPDVTGFSVVLTPAEWDALPEIIDDWKEITKRFTGSGPNMGTFAGNPRWRWSATNEAPANRWEVLGASAPALSGIPGNYYNQVPAAQLLGAATYEPPVGATALLNWLPQGVGSPYVSGASDDASSDAVLIFGQDPPTITGFGVTTLSQAISGIGEDCFGGAPCCIPSAILYNRITWPFQPSTKYAEDSFSRVIVDGLGDADVGGTWTVFGTAADVDVDGSRVVIQGASGSRRGGSLDTIGATDFDIRGDWTIENVFVAGTTNVDLALMGRYTDTSNHYYGNANVTAAGVVQAQIVERVGGVATTLATLPLPYIGGAGSAFTGRFMGKGQLLKYKVWPTGDPEPDYWQVEISDTTLTTGPGVGFFFTSGGANGNIATFDNFVVTPPQFWFGAYELQRQDDLTDWQTIMMATSPAATGFNDFEARVGLESMYRIRQLDALNFAGTWSSEVSVTMPAPGISGGSDCFENGHVLIFTTNAIQRGSRNLAYAPIWESSVAEDFGFPEAGQVSFQAMYDRDFVTAFHPLERGGETFSREILVQAAAIPPETLADFTDLRDLAWESVPYVCVRDEDGNRWFATIVVPAGRVRNLRRLYTSQIQVIETTATAAPINPTELPS